MLTAEDDRGGGTGAGVHVALRRAKIGRMRSGAELVRATLPFAQEDRAKTWRLFLTAAALQAAAVAFTVAAPTALQPLGSLAIALLIVRLFMFLHDAEHGAVFVGDAVGHGCLAVLAVLTMNVPSSWKRAHDRHHRTNAEPLRPPLDGYLPGDLLNRTVTVAQWRAMSAADRWRCRVVTHPLVLVLGFVTAFAIGHGIGPFVRDRRQVRNPATLLAWATIAAGLAVGLGPTTAAFVFVLPNLLASAFGTYLFFAQHHFPAARILGESDWNLVDAALLGSSFIDMPRWLHWVTGDIAHHHVHHLNHRIPFYRLAEAMAAIPELQAPGRTSLHPRDVLACLRCNVWDPEQGRLVSFAEADGPPR